MRKHVILLALGLLAVMSAQAQFAKPLKKKGEAKIKEEIPKLGIYETAEKNAEAFFRTLLVEMGFRESGINIKFE